MIKRLFICFVISCFLLTSCRTTRQDTQKESTHIETFTEQKQTYRDTVLYAPKAETSLKIPVSELAFKKGLNSVSKPKTFTQKNGNATARINIIHDTIVVTATCDSLAIVAKIKHELQREVKATARSDTQNQEIKTGFTFWNVILAFVLGVIVGAIALFVLSLFIKR